MSEKKRSNFIMCFLVGAHLVQTGLGNSSLDQIHTVFASVMLFCMFFFNVPIAAFTVLGLIALSSFFFTSLLLFGTFMLVVIATFSLPLAPGNRSILRFGLFATYFLAAFHKLNTDFFNPHVTCSTLVFELFPAFESLHSNTTIVAVMPWLAIMTEGFMAMGLLSKRLVPYALLTAISFHILMLGGSIFSMALNLLPLAAAFINLPDAKTELRIQRIFSLLLLPFILRKWRWAFEFQSLDWVVSDQILQASAALILSGFAFIIFQNRRRCEPLVFADLFKNLKGKVTFFFIFLWGAQPYLGLSTMQSFTMASNLRTETNPNHLLMRHVPQIFSLQNDLVSFDEYSQIMSGCDEKTLIKEPSPKRVGQSGIIPYGRFSKIPRLQVESLHLRCRNQNQGWRMYFQFRAVDEPSQCRN